MGGLRKKKSQFSTETRCRNIYAFWQRDVGTKIERVSTLGGVQVVTQERKDDLDLDSFGN